MDYDFITTCNWTTTGTYTLKAYLGSGTDVATSYSLFYRKKGDTTWIETTTGEIVIASTGEWEIGNDWNKSGNDCLTHSYRGITAIDECTSVEFNETSLGATVGNFFMYACWRECTSLALLPSDFNLPSGLTSVGSNFLSLCFSYCTPLSSMPSGFNLPSGLTTVGNSFLYACWYSSTSLSLMPPGFNIPSGLTSIGSSFCAYAWYNCTLLDDDGYTEGITFEFTSGLDVFGGTCPITTASPIVGTKSVPVNIAVNRPGVATAINNAIFFATNF